MKAPILSRLLVGSALTLMVALGAIAMRAAQPTEDLAVIPDPAAAPQASAQKFVPAPAMEPAPAVTAPRTVDAARAPIEASRPAKPSGASSTAAKPSGKDHGSCDGDDAAACPSSEGRSVASSRPTISRDDEFSVAPRAASSRGSHAGDRHVSSGPMRMLGGAETTW